MAFTGKRDDVEIAFRVGMIEWLGRCRVAEVRPIPGPFTATSFWVPPLPGVLKLNFDCSWSPGLGFQLKRLDRCLVSCEFLDRFPNLEHLPRSSSGHCTILLHSDFLYTRRRLRFRFEDFWLCYRDIQQVVECA